MAEVQAVERLEAAFATPVPIPEKNDPPAADELKPPDRAAPPK
jgi:hypothetical protein